MKGSKYFSLYVAGLSAIAIASATSASAEIIKTDAGLAGKKFCWSGGFDQENYGRDHTYVFTTNRINYQTTTKGTWAISKNGTVTLKFEGGAAQLRRYEIEADGEHVKDLTNTIVSYQGQPGKRC